MTATQYNPLGHGDAQSVRGAYGVYGTEGGKGMTAQLNPQWQQWFDAIRKSTGQKDIRLGGRSEKDWQAGSIGRMKEPSEEAPEDAGMGGMITNKLKNRQPDYAKSLGEWQGGTASLSQVGQGSSDWASLSPAQKTQILTQGR
jgi:hypothetical protein